MSLPDEQARNAFMQQAQQQRIQFTTQAGRYEIGQVRQYEADMQDATLKTYRCSSVTRQWQTVQD